MGIIILLLICFGIPYIASRGKSGWIAVLILAFLCLIAAESIPPESHITVGQWLSGN